MNYFEDVTGDNDFTMVNRRVHHAKSKPRWNSKQQQAQYSYKTAKPNSANVVRGKKKKPPKTKKNAYRRYYTYTRTNRKYRPSVEIQSEWGEPIKHINFNVLEKVTADAPEPTTLYVSIFC